MASKKYKINQEIDLVSTGKDKYRWTVTITIGENDEQNEPVVSATGVVKSKYRAADAVKKFTRWALKAFDIFEQSADDDDDDDDDED